MVSLRPLAALPVVGVVADARTYRHLLYLLIAVPLGFLYSGIGSFALVFGLVFSVVLVGVGLLVAAVVGSRLVAGLERWLANRLLGTDLAAPDDLRAAADDGDAGAVATVRAYLAAPSTWRGLGFLSLKFWVTVVAFAPLAVLAQALSLVAAPVRYPYSTQFGEVNGEPAVWAIDTAPEAALAAGLGVAGLLVGLHLTNLIASGARLMAEALLGDDAESDAEPAGDDGGAESGAERVTVDGDAADREGDAGRNRDGDRDSEEGNESGEGSDSDSDADGFEFDADPADSDASPRDPDADRDERD
ncbi:sensor domain-containing protein [Halorubrum trapanicum]|uniref:sensor domain-containing protein n=1 Tax=Halorubrum trapanicum TaxID=29284 RepID=UPI000BBA535B|nr:sensor domain-containing protein [Halorubrum trapanicum]